MYNITLLLPLSAVVVMFCMSAQTMSERDKGTHLLFFFMFFCTVHCNIIILYNINQQNAPFLN